VILAYHSIITAYGFWLPNDPRGSWSDYVRCWGLRRFGPATKVDTRRSVAARPHNRTLRLAAKQALKYPEVHFTGVQARAIGRGFQSAVNEAGYRILACSILPEHVHLVIERCERKVEQIIAHLKAKATMRLRAEGIHPLAAFVDRKGSIPTPWAEKSWSVYLDDAAAVRRAIAYVEQNPLKERKRPQRWPFIAMRNE
jgi:REP element-mobilizing transposase RayT